MTDSITTATVGRRGVLKGGALGAAAFSVPLQALMARQAAAATNAQGEATALAASPYGPVAPVNCLSTGLPLLQLPSGFSYRSFSYRGDAMSDGQRVPAGHDGMAVVKVGTGRNAEHVLIRNHELGGGTPLVVKNADGTPSAKGMYDPAVVAGGCTVMRVNASGQLVDHRAAIGGTVGNCAGGGSPWGTWFTCEETIAGVDNTPGLLKKHGYVFEVSSNPSQTNAVAITDMGRFPHEAIAIDPKNGDIFQTEDSRNYAGFYRYRPNNTARVYGSAAEGGVLEAAHVVGVSKANLINIANAALLRPSTVSAVGQSFQIEWVRVLNPDASPTAGHDETGVDNPAPATNATVSGPFKQARDAGALRMSRGEGIWWAPREDAAYIVDTSFGIEPGGQRRAGRGFGAVWKYQPSRTDRSKGTLTLVYASANSVAGNNPDNITISPRGGIMCCDDGSNVVDQFGPGQRLTGLTNAGDAYVFAKNALNLSAANLASMSRTGQFNPGDYRGIEFAGACFDPTGRVLYCNIQTPGVTFAITGPWSRGNL